jgi:hypothetical protein
MQPTPDDDATSKFLVKTGAASIGCAAHAQGMLQLLGS